jgi:MtN3 and saliva related transmembrane protein
MAPAMVFIEAYSRDRLNMSALTYLWLAAACCTTLAFLPQVIETWKTKSTADLSLAMFLLLVAGVLLWLTYGLIPEDIPLIVANDFSLLLCAVILAFKIRYG